MEWLLSAVVVVLFLLPIPFVLKRITASKTTIQSWPWGKIVLISLIVTGVAFVYSGLLAGLLTLLWNSFLYDVLRDLKVYHWTTFTETYKYRQNLDSAALFGIISGLFLLAACTLGILIRIAWIWLSGEDKE